MKRLLCSLCGLFFSGVVLADDEPPAVEAMTEEQLATLVKRIDPEAEGQLGFWSFDVDGVPVTLISDGEADRMRLLVPIVEAAELGDGDLYRAMQANFDSALDARYAIAKEILWSAFIHPLSSLDDREFLEGLGQTVNLARSYGSSYSSGLLIFRGGDSEALQQKELIEELVEKGLAI